MAEQKTPKISRRNLMASAAALAAIPRASWSAGKRAKQPNIVWIVCHDIHAPLLGCYGNALAQTPAIDGLAKDGIRYDNAFTTTPVCSPSRFALITGAYPQSCAPAHQMRAAAQLPAALKPLPQHLRAAGYYCTNNVFTDYNMDADERAMWDECSITAHWRNRPTGKPFFCVYNYLITHEGQVFVRGATQTDPAKVIVPPFLPDRPQIRQVLARNIDMVNRQDLAIAHLLEELKADGLEDDTIVFFMADHGGVHPRSKRYCYDDGLRVPLIVRIPAAFRFLSRSPMSSVSDELVSHVDLAPTVLSLAGLRVPTTMMGRTFLGQHRTAKRDFVFSMRDRMDERYDLVYTVRNNRYRYTRNYMPQRIYGEHEAYEWQSEAYQEWERAHLAGELNATQSRFWQTKPTEELYDVIVDPHEVVNLANDPSHHAALALLRRALDEHLLAINDNGFIPEGSKEQGYDASRTPGTYPLPLVIDTANLAISGDPKNMPQFLKGLEHPNQIVRFWNAHGLILIENVPSNVVELISQRLETEHSDPVKCALCEALLVAGKVDLARDKLGDILQQSSSDWSRLRALNVLTGLTPDQLRPIRSVIATVNDKYGEYIYRASNYLLTKIDGTYEPGSRLIGKPEYKIDPSHPIGDPRI